MVILLKCRDRHYMKKNILIISTIFAASFLFTSQVKAQDQADQDKKEQIRVDSINAVEAQKNLDEQRLAGAKSDSKDAKAKAKEAQRIEADANRAAHEAKNSLKAEKRAQKARKQADKQAKKAEAARIKSANN